MDHYSVINKNFHFSNKISSKIDNLSIEVSYVNIGAILKSDKWTTGKKYH